jgi:hypothetical protein
MVEALTNDVLIHEAPAIIGRLPPSALMHRLEAENRDRQLST